MTTDGAGASTARPEGDRSAGLRGFVAALLALTALHAVLAVALPVSGDEAYYWDCSRHAEWSSFDQPKLVIDPAFWPEFMRNGFHQCVHRAHCGATRCLGLNTAYVNRHGWEADLLVPLAPPEPAP